MSGSTAATILDLLFTNLVRSFISMLKRVFSSSRSTSRRNIMMKSDTNNEIITTDGRTFVLFSSLSNELKIHIIAFVADAPFEPRRARRMVVDDTSATAATTKTKTKKKKTTTTANDSSNNNTWESSLTHVLPFVNKEFYSYCKLDEIWKLALVRMLDEHEPQLWNEMIDKLFPKDDNDETNNTIITTPSTTTPTSLSLLNQAYNSSVWSEQSGSTSTSTIETTVEQEQQQQQQPHQPKLGGRYCEIYKYIVNYGLRQTHPVFIMPSTITIGEPYGLHFFEPRYRLLVADLMRELPRHYRAGHPLIERRPSSDSATVNNGTTNNHTNNEDDDDDDDDDDEEATVSSLKSSTPIGPYFVHAHTVPVEPNATIAVLVQVLQCQIYDDGRADVILLPKRYVWLEQLWTRPHSGNLVYTQIRLLGAKELQTMGY